MDVDGRTEISEDTDIEANSMVEYGIKENVINSEDCIEK